MASSLFVGGNSARPAALRAAALRLAAACVEA